MARFEAALLAAHERNRRPASIKFQRFKKLQEPYLVEGLVDIYAPVPDQEMPRLLRLEALRAPGKPGFDVAVFQSETISAKHAYPKGKGEHQPSELAVDVWVNKELIHSVLPSVEQAL
jgi:hypothetical protein